MGDVINDESELFGHTPSLTELWGKFRVGSQTPQRGGFGYHGHDPGLTGHPATSIHYDDNTTKQVMEIIARNAAAAAKRAEAAGIVIDRSDTGSADKRSYAERTTGKQKPMLTQEEYERGRALLDMLPGGLYLKCCKCGRWKTGGGEIRFDTTGAYCEDC